MILHSTWAKSYILLPFEKSRGYKDFQKLVMIDVETIFQAIHAWGLCNTRGKTQNLVPWSMLLTKVARNLHTFLEKATFSLI